MPPLTLELARHGQAEHWQLSIGWRHQTHRRHR
jgi:hypothetical protein